MFRRATWIVLSLLLSVTLTTCVAAVTRRGSASWEETVMWDDSLPMGALGITECALGRPLVRLSKQLQGNEVLYEMVWTHEQTHIRQLRTAGKATCEDASAYLLRSSESIIAAEAEAFCVSMQVVARRIPQADPLEYLLSVARAQERHMIAWGKEVRYERIAAVFVRTCMGPLQRLAQRT